MPGGTAVPPYLVIHGLSVIVFLAACRSFARLPDGPRATIILYGVAVLCRILCLFSDPILDDDIYRYRFDGKLVDHGVNPYRFSPDADEVLPLRDALDARIGYAYIPSIYPPVSQLLFWLGYRLEPSGILGIKSLVVLADILAIAALRRLLSASGKPLSRAALYAWHPLVIAEFAQGGHQDALGILLMLSFLLALGARRRTLAALALAACALTKLVPLALLAVALPRIKARHILLCVGCVALGYAPFVCHGMAVFDGLRTYLEYWEFNASLFALLRGTLERLTAHPHEAARAVTLALTLALIAVVALRCKRRARDPLAPVDGALALFGGLLLIGSTVDPWYVCWLVPLMCVRPFAPLLILSCVVPLSYVYYLDGTEHLWVKLVEYFPVYGALAVSIYPSWLRRANCGNLPPTPC